MPAPHGLDDGRALTAIVLLGTGLLGFLVSTRAPSVSVDTGTLRRRREALYAIERRIAPIDGFGLSSSFPSPWNPR